MEIPQAVKDAGIPDPIKADHLAGRYVRILREGQVTDDPWVEVNVSIGYGIRFCRDERGDFITDGIKYYLETVVGNFKVEWNE